MGLALRVLGPTDVQERLLGQMVKVTIENCFEARNGFINRHKLAFDTGEHLGNEERLRQETLNLART